MNKVKYRFSSSSNVKLKTLVFEHAYPAPANEGSMDISITGYLDIDLECEDDPGTTWSLSVTVDGSPIISHPVIGRISGIIGKDRKGGVNGSYEW